MPSLVGSCGLDSAPPHPPFGTNPKIKDFVFDSFSNDKYNSGVQFDSSEQFRFVIKSCQLVNSTSKAVILPGLKL